MNGNGSKWPPGTVRAVIVFGLVFAVIWAGVRSEEWQTVEAMAGIALGYYFRQQHEEGGIS